MSETQPENQTDASTASSENSNPETSNESVPPSSSPANGLFGSTNNVLTVLGTVVGVALAAVMVVAMLVYGQYRFAGDEEDAIAKLKNLEAEQTKRLNGYGWVDEKKKIAHVAVEDVMKQMVANSKNKGKVLERKAQNKDENGS